MSLEPEPSDLTAAAMWGDLDLLESLLENGADPDIPNSQGNSALHIAAYYGETECASVLLSYKAQVNVQGADGKTPLHRAVTGICVQEPGTKYPTEAKIRDNQLDIVRLLMSHEADLKAKDGSGATAKDLAFQCDFYECADLIDELLEIRAEDERKQLRKSRIQGLYAACHSGAVETVKELLPHVPEAVNEFLMEGQNLLMCAAAHGHLPIVEHLLDHGAVAVCIESTNQTALHLACEAGHSDVVVCLLNRLPALLALDDLPQETSLHIASRKGHVEITKSLLAINARSKQLKTPENSYEGDGLCLYGLGNEKVKMNESLGEIAVDLMAPTFQDRRTPLHEAATCGHVEIAKLLVDFMREYGTTKPTSSHLSTPRRNDREYLSPKKLDSAFLVHTPRKVNAVPGIDAVTVRGKTAFHEAARLGHFGVMEVLLEAGADINAYMRPLLDDTINTELTALVQACLMNDLDTVRFLLQHGATDARLKALRRSLRVPYDDVAGLLLCYNGCIDVVSVVDTAKSVPLTHSTPPAVMLNISWKSKDLPYIRKEWLERAMVEAPRPKDHVCTISQLDISSNQLASLPIAVFQLPHLTQLEIFRNKLKSLPTLHDQPDGGWSCHKLTHIDLNSNQLTSLPSCLFTISELKEINANDNKITGIPATVWSAPKLQKLYLKNNCLQLFPSDQIAWGRDSNPNSPAGSSFTENMSPPDSGYLGSQPFYGAKDSISLEISAIEDSRKIAALPFTSVSKSVSRRGSTIAGKSIAKAPTQAFVSRKFENFHDTNLEVEEFEDLEAADISEEGSNSLPLEVLDLAHNNLSAIPTGLSCLAPQLQKLNISSNQIKSLGQVSDYPVDLELLDASSNELHSAIAPTPSHSDTHYLQPCARRQFDRVIESSPMQYKQCGHKSHRNLRRLSTLKLNNNKLVDLQLFRLVSRNKTSDFSISYEESTTFKQRANTASDPFAVILSPPKQVVAEEVSVSMFVGPGSPVMKIPRRKSEHSAIGNSDSSKSNSSQEGSGSSQPQPHTVISPLFPQLSTLELARNKLKAVPSHIHLITNLSCLIISHNHTIDTLPLELSNLEHLWNLEYKGCPLTNPPAEDLDKFKLDTDKLLYMRSLLHDAKPNDSLKLMLVGLQKMGKTTLLAHLRECNEATSPATTFTQRVGREEPTTRSGGSRKNKGELLSTVGVDLGIWKYRKDLEAEYLKTKKKGAKPLPSVTFYTWDFGGQEEYYVTHQCFLSTRSLYLVVWDITYGEKGIEELEPWLHNIQARAPGSPVVIIGTHCDKLRSDDRGKRKFELNEIIREKYLVGRGPQQLRELGLPKILDVMYVGCPPIGRTDGVVELRMALYDIAFSLTVPRAGHSARKTKLLEQPIPASYLQLEESVRQLAVECRAEDTPPVLKENVFRERTKDVIANPRELNQAVTFLHENGIMLHYNTPALSHLYFVDPQWLCDMLAHVITVPEVNRFIQRSDGPEAGILRTSVLAHVFKGKLFPQAHRKEYIELLGKFEVALILDRNRLLVPSMLPTRPSYSIHAYKNIFPRPSLRDILTGYSNVSKPFDNAMFTAGKRYVHETCSKSESPQPITVPSHELFRTGLFMRRFYFMTYVPSGFWPRLISRFLTASRFASVILQSLGFPEEQIHGITAQLVSGQVNSAVGLEWSYWKTGIELWYKGLSLLRVAEILPEGSFENCDPSPSLFEQTRTCPVEPAFDAADLSFELDGMWMPVDITPNRGIEIIVPDVVCPAMLQEELLTLDDDHSLSLCDTELPQFESQWMSAQTLSMTVDYIDTLLEDWYPGLGAREGNKTVESVPYVNRVIPCPFCVSGACQYDQQLDGAGESRDMDQDQDAAPEKLIVQTETSDTIANNASPLNSVSKVSDKSPKNKAKRALFPSDSNSSVRVDEYWATDQSRTHDSKSNLESLRHRSLSSPTNEASPSREKALPRRQGSLADFHRVQKMSPASSSEKLVHPVPSNFPLKLMQASKFGFMIETCILASRRSEPLVCPAHKDHPLPVRDLAPDLVFADLPNHFILDPTCVDKGEYVDHGTFGDIYHGSVYPSPAATDEEGREVAIKIDRMDSRNYTIETAANAYAEVRAEVSILLNMKHPNVIEFVGVVLQPLCFMLEWAVGGSLSSVFKKYRKVDARIGPLVLQKTAYQVASGLAYLHDHNIVYYDLKSPNVLVFQYPSAQDSLKASLFQDNHQNLVATRDWPVLVKIADMGISRRLTPGGVMGFKGSPGFMAPEILKYVGTEAVTEKVDIYSFGMFLYELISMYFPFEKQNLMGSQIEKLTVEGERPPLQIRELNNPILYLDTMRWCWQQDFRNRPSAHQLVNVLSNNSVPRLVDAISLQSNAQITCACICTLPIEIVSQNSMAAEDEDRKSFISHSSSVHPHLATGDLQDELWICMYSPDESHTSMSSKVCIINFRGKTNFSTESFAVCNSKISSICGVTDTVWLGTEEGQVFIVDAIMRHLLFNRHLAIHPDQSIISIIHLQSNRQVLVARKDGCVMLFDQGILEHKIPDNSRYDNHMNNTQLPVRAVFKTPEKLPLFCAHVCSKYGDPRTVLWCGTSFELLLVFDVYQSHIEYCRKLYSRPRYSTSEENHVSELVTMKSGEKQHIWALSHPSNRLYCWDTESETLLQTVCCDQYTTDPVSSVHSMGSQLQLALPSGKILLMNTDESIVTSTVELQGHMKVIYSMLPIGCRILPKHWLPSIIGRSNAIDYYKELLGEDDIQSITSTMVGRQSRLLVTVGQGFYGVAGKVVEPLMSPKDREENFVLLWSLFF